MDPPFGVTPRRYVINTTQERGLTKFTVEGVQIRTNIVPACSKFYLVLVRR